MKGLNKIALATAVAAAPFATQAMEPMNDSQMGDVTGQAGVTIELQTKVDIDQFSYQQDTAGSFVVDGISVGGHNRTEGEQGYTFDASMEIDLMDNGDALISFGGLYGDGSGDPTAGGDVPVLLGFDFASAGLEGDDGTDATQATLMSDFTSDIFLTQLDIRASTENLESGVRTDAGGHIAIDVGFAMDMDVDFDVAAVGLRDLSIAGVGSLGAMQAAAADPDQSNAEAGLGTAGPAVVNMTVHPGTPIGSYSSLVGDQPEEALIVNVDNFEADIWIDDIRIGRDGGEIGADQSIGSVGLENLQVTNTRLAIYGRN